MKNIAVMGAGTWGTALALLLNKNGNNVTMWGYMKEEIDEMQKTRENKYLKGVQIPEGIELSHDLRQTIADKDIILVVVPSKFMRDNLVELSKHINDNQVIVIASKGIEENTLLTMTDISKEIMPANEVAALSGPSHAEEVSKGMPTTCIIATEKKEIANMLQDVFMSESFRVYTNPDILGVELGGALKNIIALAAGTVDGLELGDNTKAALMTRGLVEITKIGLAKGADLRTFYGLSGLGDLIVTCGSMHSRNRRTGILLGKGYSLEEAKKEVQMVVEGVYAAKAGHQLAKKYNLELPIIEAVNKVLFENKKAMDVVEHLMGRQKKEELAEDMEIFNAAKWE